MVEIKNLKYVDSVVKLQQVLRYWKAFTFDRNYLDLDDTVKAIGTPEQPVERKEDYPGRWVLSRIGEKASKPATFHTAGVVRFVSDMETGNYVPPGKTPPGNLAESRIQDTPSPL
ncbi:hypothetical protein OH77DRAFT_1440637, partial [Trametes cingulata]